MTEWLFGACISLLAGLLWLLGVLGILKRKEYAKAGNEVKAGSCTDAGEESADVKISGGKEEEGRHLYMETDARTRELLLQEQHRRQSQSTMQIQAGKVQEEKTVKESQSQEISSNATVISAPSQEIRTGKTVNLSPSLRISNGMTNVLSSSPMVEASGQRFRWPSDAKNLESAPVSKSCLIPEVLQNLEELGILRSEAQGEVRRLEGLARRSGRTLTRKQVRISFDTFMAKSRPGLESDEELKESPKPKKKNKKNKNNKKNDVSKNWHEGKAKKVIQTQGWDNPAWKTDYARLIKPVSGPSLVRAF